MKLARKLSSMFFPRPNDVALQPVQADAAHPGGSPQAGVVIPFPAPAGMENAGAPPAPGPEALEVPASRLRPQVLFHLPDLRDFLDLDHALNGRRQGVQIGNAAAHAQGRDAMIADFQLRLQRVIAFKQAKLDMLEHMGLQTRGLGLGVAEEVDAARAHIKRDIERLDQQVEAAARGQGWIEGPLAQFALGFNEGVRVRMNFYITQ
jgi:hypothetical protein